MMLLSYLGLLLICLALPWAYGAVGLLFAAAGVGAIQVALKPSRTKLGYFDWVAWRSVEVPERGFFRWRSEFSITEEAGTPIRGERLIIAQQDAELTYLVYHPIPPGEYELRVSFVLPRAMDYTPYLMSLFVWMIIYVSVLAFLFVGSLGPSSPLALYAGKLHGFFTETLDFLRSLLLPMIAIGGSMSITSLIHYINRSPAQRHLLRLPMTLVLGSTAGAVLLPAVLALFSGHP